MCINQEIVLTRVLTKQVVLYLLSVLVGILYTNHPAISPSTCIRTYLYAHNLHIDEHWSQEGCCLSQRRRSNHGDFQEESNREEQHRGGLNLKQDTLLLRTRVTWLKHQNTYVNHETMFPVSF